MKHLKLGLVLIAGATLSACNEYTTEICGAGVRADMPGFAGDYKQVSAQQYSDNQGNVTNSVITDTYHVVKIDQGRYTISASARAAKRLGSNDSNSQQVSTCKIGNNYLMEAFNGTTLNTYTSMVVQMNAAGGVDQSLAAFDKAQLDAASVPYKIVTRKNSQSTLFTKTMQARDGSGKADDTYKVLVVDNSTMANPSSAGAYLHQLSDFMTHLF